MKISYPTRKLGDILELCDAGTWGDESASGMPLLRSTNMQNGQLVLDDLKYINVPKDKSERYTLREGDILITKSSGSVDHIGKSLFISKEMSGKYGFSNFTQRLRINRKIAMPEWAYLKISDPATRSFLLNASQTTTGLRNLKIQALNELEIPLPPVGEQKRIIAKIEKQFAEIDKAARLRAESGALAGQLLPAALHEIFSSSEWQEKELDELADIKHGFAFQSQYFTDAGDYVLLTPGNFWERGGYRDRGDKQKHYDGPIPNGFVLKKGDLLVAMTEQAAGLLGSPIFVPESGNFLHNQRLGKFVFEKSGEILPEFLYYFLNWQGARDAISRTAAGTKVRHTSPKKILEIKIPLPPLAEQKKILKKLDALAAKARTLRDLQSSQSAALKSLKQSILHRAFQI